MCTRFAQPLKRSSCVQFKLSGTCLDDREKVSLSMMAARLGKVASDRPSHCQLPSSSPHLWRGHVKSNALHFFHTSKLPVCFFSVRCPSQVLRHDVVRSLKTVCLPMCCFRTAVPYCNPKALAHVHVDALRWSRVAASRCVSDVFAHRIVIRFLILSFPGQTPSLAPPLHTSHSF